MQLGITIQMVVMIHNCEHRVFIKLWKSRVKQIKSVNPDEITTYGTIQGIRPCIHEGLSMLKLEGLEFLELLNDCNQKIR